MLFWKKVKKIKIKVLCGGERTPCYIFVIFRTYELMTFI